MTRKYPDPSRRRRRLPGQRPERTVTAAELAEEIARIARAAAARPAVPGRGQADGTAAAGRTA